MADVDEMVNADLHSREQKFGLDGTITLMSGGVVRLIGRDLSRDGVVEMLDMVKAATLRER